MEKSFKYRASASIYVNELLNADKLLISFKTTGANTYVDCKNNARSRTVCSSVQPEGNSTTSRVFWDNREYISTTAYGTHRYPHMYTAVSLAPELHTMFYILCKLECILLVKPRDIQHIFPSLLHCRLFDLFRKARGVQLVPDFRFH